MMTDKQSDLIQQLSEATDQPAEQLRTVYRALDEDGSFSSRTIETELRWFYGELRLDRYYFEATPASLVAEHVKALAAAKILARTSGESAHLYLHTAHDDFEMHACRDEHQIAVDLERKLEEDYAGYRLHSYCSRGSAAPDSGARLRLYFLRKPDYPDGAERQARDGSSDINKLAAREFLKRARPRTRRYYEKLLARAKREHGPLIEIRDRPEKHAKQIVIAHRRGSTHSYFSAVSDVLNYYGVSSRRKYIEQFADGTVIYSIFIHDGLDPQALGEMNEDLSLVYTIPQTSLTPLFRSGQLSAQEVVYAYAGWKFVHQFSTRYRSEYATLASALGNDHLRLGILGQLRLRLAKDTFTEDRIFETIVQHCDLIKQLYADFAEHHFTTDRHRVQAFDRHHNPELESKLLKAVSSEIDQTVLHGFLTFNRHILATNFYKDTKVALAFRLDPAFLSEQDYPERPHGIFFFVGSEFRGFHVRFRDVARGGIRIIRSRDIQAYKNNIDQLFNETYQLARTQQKKNKDIPEGGAKGAIALSLEHPEKSRTAFEKYIGSMLDLLLPNDEIYDHRQAPEILFLGPDEGTAELMDWASNHARERGYPFWKAFTTGKSVRHGGIPHDLYGMTTHSVHQYVIGILDKLGIDESRITKFQTGGPDGDLGSNEIKISKDRTTSVVDGSGVLHDPDGIDRDELLRLARARLPVEHFARDKLGPRGWLITLDQRDVELPDNTLVESGFAWRNGFHLDPRSSADLFVPCGGRPDSVHITNVEKLFDEAGNPRFRFIVEGANLFFTREARLELERAGVIVFKDASANKGGVTSSSLEVLAALAFDDASFAEHLEVHEGEPPRFYRAYVEEVLERIRHNARLEFERIWIEHERTQTPRTALTDVLSDKITALHDAIMLSELYDDERLRRSVLEEACPRTLLETVGLDALIERVPDNYLRAIFCSHLASRYIYTCGLEANEVRFFEFLSSYLSKAS